MFARDAALESDLILDALIAFWQKDWDESQHPREPAGTPEGGQFAGGGGGEAGGGAAELHPEAVNVGGDAWNKETAVKLETKYQNAKPELEKIADAAIGKKATTEIASNWEVVAHPAGSEHGYALINSKDEYAQKPEGGVAAWPTKEEAEAAIEQYAETQPLEDEEEGPYQPESWDEMSGAQQDAAEQQYIEQSTPGYVKNEQDHYYESGQALDDAKSMIAHDNNAGKDDEWLRDAIDVARPGSRSAR